MSVWDNEGCGGRRKTARARRWLAGIILLLACGWGGLTGVEAASAKISKVLPHLLDREGRHVVSPSLYERDAYQAYLRQHPEEVGGLRFDVSWKVSRELAEGLRLRIASQSARRSLVSPQ